MAAFKVAHINQQGQNMVIVPLEASFGTKPPSEQAGLIEQLQLCSESAGLAGKVVPVWRVGQSFRFIAPPQWKAFFQSLTWNQIARSINKQLTCG